VKKNWRLVEMPSEAAPPELELKRIAGAVLVQEPDRHELDPGELKVSRSAHQPMQKCVR